MTVLLRKRVSKACRGTVATQREVQRSADHAG